MSVERAAGLEPLRELGEYVCGQVIDEKAWQQQDKVRASRPHRHLDGVVCAVYPNAPEIVGIRFSTVHAPVTVFLGPCGCASCPHDLHDPGDCLVGILGPEGEPAYCLCGAPR